jgi:hypothetical protein
MCNLRIISFIFLLFLASTHSAAAQRPDFQADTLSNGVVHVHNSGVPLWTEATRWRLEEEFRLGRSEGGGPDQFGNLLAFRVDGNRRLYVLDAFDREIRVFDSLGIFTHTIGHRGSGPGEFESPQGISVSPDDFLWVVDPATTRYSVFGPEGDYEAGYTYRRASVILPNPDEFTSAWGYVSWGTRREPPQSGGNWTNHIPVVFSPPNQYDSMPPLRGWTAYSSDGRQRPGAGGLLYHVSRTGDLWYAPNTTEYQIYRRSLDGDTTLVITLEAPPVPWTDSQRDSLLERLSGQRRASLRSSDVARFRPIVRKIFTDAAGHLFVIPQLPASPEGSAIDVFEETGRYLGRLPLPEPITFRIVSPFVTEDHLYALVLDEFDVSYLVSWRIIKPQGEADPAEGPFIHG